MFFLLNCPSFNCFLGYIQSSGKSLAEKNMPHFREFHLQFRERIIKHIPFPKKKRSSSKRFKWTRGMQFRKPVEMFSLRSRKFFDQCSKMDNFLFLLQFFFKKFFYPQNVLKDKQKAVLTSALKLFRWKAKKLSLCPKLYKRKCKSFGNSLSPTNVVMHTHRLHFWQPQPKILTKGQKNCSTSKIGYKSQFFQ